MQYVFPPIGVGQGVGQKIRLLASQDFYNGFLETLAALKPVDLSTEAALRLFWTKNNSNLTFVALEGEAVIGTASLLIEQKFIHKGGLVGHIEDVAVHKDHQKKGVGQALLNRLIEEGRQQGCYKLLLDCSLDLVPFYEKLGFYSSVANMRLDL